MGAEQRGRQHAGPAVEQHHGLGPGFDLCGEVGDRRLGQHRHQPREQGGLHISHGADMGEVLRPAAFDHVAGDGEGRAGEADQGRGIEPLGRQARPHALDRLQDRRDRQDHTVRIEGVDAGMIGQARQYRPLALRVAQAVAECPGQHQDVAEQDCPVHAEPADRLQRYLGGQIGIGAERDEVARLGADLSVFRQVTASLAHQPDRRRPDGLPAKDTKQGLRWVTRHRVHRLHLTDKRYLERDVVSVGGVKPGVPRHPPSIPVPSTRKRRGKRLHLSFLSRSSPRPGQPSFSVPRLAVCTGYPHYSKRDTTGGVSEPVIPVIIAFMTVDRLNLHLVSDATGETLNAIARATTAQFEHVDIIYHRWSLIRTRFQLHRVLEGIETEPGPVLSTLVDKALRSDLELTCGRLEVPLVNVLDPVMNLLAEHIGEQAAARPGKQYVLNADYFRRIDAMHYVLAHDDGQAQPGLAEADVILVGVSRSSKTPTCFYLANRGIKAANVPLVPNLPQPPELEAPHCPVIGLTLDAKVLIDIRWHRLKLIGTGANAGMVRQNGAEYVGEEAVKAELLWARRLCVSRGWPVIDVTRRSIEETAATVLQLMDAWHERQAKAMQPAPTA